MPNNLDKVKNIKFNELNSTIEGTKQFLVTYDCGDKHLAEVIFIEERKRMTPNKYLKLAEKEFNKRIASKANTTFFTKKKIIAFAVAGAIAVAAAVTIPCVLLLGGNKTPGVTYDLLWNTKITKLENHLEVKNEKGITTIYKKSNGEIDDNFKVLVFTDLHLDHRQDLGNYAYTMIAKNIMNVKPDFVFFCGDNITSIENKQRAIEFAEMMEKLNVYWSFVLGNHEGREYPEKPMMSRPEQVNLFASYEHCLMDPSTRYTDDGEPVWGNGNHIINVLNSKNEVAQSFFLLDSGDKLSKSDIEKFRNAIATMIMQGKIAPDETEFYDYVKDSQIQWYQEQMSKINAINSTVFSHVPLRDMELAYIYYYDWYEDEHGCWGDYPPQGVGSGNVWPFTEVLDEVTHDDTTIKMRCGHRAEDMCYSPHDFHQPVNNHTKLYYAMLESGGVHPAFFCGHDHQNNFTLDETVQVENQRKTLTMGYIQPACYSSNNFWTKGFLARDPLDDATINKHHLIQGYSILDYNLLDPSNPFEINNYTNYNLWGKAYYSEALDLIKADRKKEYAPTESYIGKDPNDPLNDSL